MCFFLSVIIGITIISCKEKAGVTLEYSCNSNATMLLKQREVTVYC